MEINFTKLNTCFILTKLVLSKYNVRADRGGGRLHKCTKVESEHNAYNLFENICCTTDEAQIRTSITIDGAFKTKTRRSRGVGEFYEHANKSVLKRRCLCLASNRYIGFIHHRMSIRNGWRNARRTVVQVEPLQYRKYIIHST